MRQAFVLFCLVLCNYPLQAVTTQQTQPSTSVATTQQMQTSTPVEISLGSEDAPHTIIEYTSLTCNHCADFQLNILPVIKKQYIDTGQLRLIIRPFSMDKDALQAFKLVNALPEKRRELALTKAFGSQSRWIGKDTKTLAKILGLNETESKKAIENQPLENALFTCVYKAQKDLKVDATPTFFFGDKKIEGAPTLAEFTASFEEFKKEKKLS